MVLNVSFHSESGERPTVAAKGGQKGDLGAAPKLMRWADIISRDNGEYVQMNVLLFNTIII